eukprot:COSAG01_NODE_3652_length_5823_cov_16.582635_3_plen_51_part_00
MALATSSLAFLRICAFVRRPIRPYISGVETAVVSILRIMRPTGGVAVSFW